MADISKFKLDATNPSSPVYNLKDELARFERISYAQWQQMTPEQQAAKPYYIYDYPSERFINAENVGYDNTESGLTAEDVQEAVDELKSGLTNLIKVYHTSGTTDSVGDFNFSVPGNGTLLYVRPLRDSEYYNSWWGVILASTLNNVSHSAKAIKDDGTALASQSIKYDVYYLTN